MNLCPQRVSGRSEPFTDTRLRILILDVNDKSPKFEGLDETLLYSTAVTDETRTGDLVITVFAFDLDGSAPNNVVNTKLGLQALHVLCR